MSDERKQQDLKVRTRQFAVRVIRLYCALPQSPLGQTLGKQLLRAGTSVGAHYREAHRARSDAEFISKLEGGLQELEETAYWLELLVEAGVIPPEQLAPLQQEAGELTAILIASVRTVRVRMGRS
ncbi:MAG: four helix bundle protein [Gemmataceae bacterium]